jgi:hypothetical protein
MRHLGLLPYTLFSILNVNPYKINYLPIKKSALVFTQGEEFSVGDPFYIWRGEVLRLAPLNNVKICCLFQKHGNQTTMHSPHTHLQGHSRTSLPPKGKKKKKKSGLYWVHAAISHWFE